jgi:hypothetical protein
MERIQFELKDKKYIAKYVSDRSILFKDNPWRTRWNFEPYMLDEGEFLISDNPSDGKLLTLNYYYHYLGIVLNFAIMVVVLSCWGEYWGILFFAAFFGVTVPIDIMRSKGKARELVEAILQTDN